jgi:hypothetical protein
MLISGYLFDNLISLMDANDILMSESYLETLKRIHDFFLPKMYLEIGIRHGKSLALASPETCCIAIDPEPEISVPVHKNTLIFPMTSDMFFSTVHADIIDPGSLDIAFIDGMHLFEYALRDFINIEKYCHDTSVIILHDCFPVDYESSQRTRTQLFWTGDVWKMIVALKMYRKDVKISLLDSDPSGLALISHVDPHSTILRDLYDTLCDQYIPIHYEWFEKNKGGYFPVIDAKTFDFTRIF